MNTLASLGDTKVDTRSQVLISEGLSEDNTEKDDRSIERESYVYGASKGLNKNINNQRIGGENILIQGIAFLSSANPSGRTGTAGAFSKNRGSVITYEVQSGDTPSYIASLFGISTNTILWANDLSYWGLIKPGDKLTILPTSGVLHKVKKGETLAKIVGTYSGDLEETISFNGMPADGSIQLSQEIIIPNGKKPIYYRSQPTVKYASYTGPYSGKSRNFPWGQCTWYVAQKRYVPWSGHAKSWLANARARGYSVCQGQGCEPKAGAIISMTGGSWLIRLYGHVAYVESVNGDWVTFSEANYIGLGKRSVRTMHKNDWRIQGYIY